MAVPMSISEVIIREGDLLSHENTAGPVFHEKQELFFSSVDSGVPCR
jgi:hypothetical protein